MPTAVEQRHCAPLAKAFCSKGHSARGCTDPNAENVSLQAAHHGNIVTGLGQWSAGQRMPDAVCEHEVGTREGEVCVGGGG